MSSTSRSTPNPRWIYDVFLNFRGRDTRAIFVSHLYNSLTNAGIYVFKDNEELPLGGQISESLLQAIQVSNIAIIVFSRNYGNSKWCLKELEKIMDCRRTKRQVVIPVFYNIDPSDVGYQKGAFGKAFQQLRKRVSNHEIRVWEKILGEASKLSGFHLNNSRFSCVDKNIRGLPIFKTLTRK
ncbi:TMV resistance protein N-like [Arachis stenosperma]|uniref:TMV resistance protein N-like n=1 Tax=Arachis stenosperma TaxID=217475 RepID=UPI0025AD72D2|nr:TMV resistance protein N-like [Arachis stenosperma]